MRTLALAVVTAGAGLGAIAGPAIASPSTDGTPIVTAEDGTTLVSQQTGEMGAFSATVTNRNGKYIGHGNKVCGSIEGLDVACVKIKK
ncbi:hypothetical protein AB0N89_33975 [Amycolatopsis sp. NPDC089917]|uniref:hypothetical protein n=1 Tax=Amycolatopsis sp. NPDC089917 TaxID=3155187 RepID=UPI0034193F7C